VLQWGRDRAVAESTGISLHADRRAKLQWGRDRAVAESIQSTPLAAVAVPASMGPRPRGRGIELGPRQFEGRYDLLQWGRDRAVAESIRANVKIDGKEYALQWGRDRAVAESNSNLPTWRSVS